MNTLINTKSVKEIYDKNNMNTWQLCHRDGALYGMAGKPKFYAKKKDDHVAKCQIQYVINILKVVVAIW